MRVAAAALLAFSLLLAAYCRAPGTADAPQPAPIEATSLLGEALRRPELPEATREEFERRLRAAWDTLARRRDDRDAWIWVGRRTAYLGRYREAIDVFSEALQLFPDDPRLLRHRGHRWLTVRQLDSAERDLARAGRLVRGTPDEVEPDGLPNARGIPTSTLQSNIWYHLGLTRYVKGEYDRALDAWKEALKVSTNPDMLVATSHWTWLTLRRLDRPSEARALLAPITRELDVIENQSYLRLLLLYKGELPADSILPPGDVGATSSDVAAAYGVGAWHLVEGREAEAERVFRRIVAGPQWPAFGYLAAEAELRRMREARRAATRSE